MTLSLWLQCELELQFCCLFLNESWVAQVLKVEHLFLLKISERQLPLCLRRAQLSSFPTSAAFHGAEKCFRTPLQDTEGVHWDAFPRGPASLGNVLQQSRSLVLCWSCWQKLLYKQLPGNQSPALPQPMQNLPLQG